LFVGLGFFDKLARSISEGINSAINDVENAMKMVAKEIDDWISDDEAENDNQQQKPRGPTYTPHTTTTTTTTTSISSTSPRHFTHSLPLFSLPSNTSSAQLTQRSSFSYSM
jgi:hypothetical protein